MIINSKTGEKFITFEEAPAITLRRILVNLHGIDPVELRKIQEWVQGKRAHLFFNEYYFPEQKKEDEDG